MKTFSDNEENNSVTNFNAILQDSTATKHRKNFSLREETETINKKTAINNTELDSFI